MPLKFVVISYSPHRKPVQGESLVNVPWREGHVPSGLSGLYLRSTCRLRFLAHHVGIEANDLKITYWMSVPVFPFTKCQAKVTV